MTSQSCDIDKALIDQRQQVNYWRAMHARAVERESLWKEKAEHLEAVVRRQEDQLGEQCGQIEALKAKVSWLQQQVFGRKSEESSGSSCQEQAGDEERVGSSASSPEDGRNRGRQAGAKGHGRRRRENLPTEEIIHSLPVGG